MQGSDLPDEWFSGVKAQLLSLLFSPTGSLSVGRHAPPVPLPSFPWLSFFLSVSCRHTLNVVAMAFDSQDWTVYIDTLGEGEEEERRREEAAGGPAAGLPSGAAAAAALLLRPESIPIPEGESLPEEFLQAAAQAQAAAMTGHGGQRAEDGEDEAVNGLPSGQVGAGDDSVVRLTATGVPSRQAMLDALTLLLIDQKQSVPPDIQRASTSINPHPTIYQPKVRRAAALRLCLRLLLLLTAPAFPLSAAVRPPTALSCSSSPPSTSARAS